MLKTFCSVSLTLALLLCCAVVSFAEDAKPSAKAEKTTLENMPGAARDALKKLAGDNAITKVEAKGSKEKRYIAEWKADGKEHEAHVSADGKLIKTEEDIDAKDVPEAVQAAAKKAAGSDAKLSYVKIFVAKGEKTTYDVTAKTENTEKELCFDASGKQIEESDDGEDEDDSEEEDGEDEDD